MKYIITERQEDYLDRWNKFRLFMKRRDADIKELISKYSNRPRTNKHRVLDDVLVELSNMNNVDNESETFDWMYLYLNDHYFDYIEKKFERIDESVIDDIEDDKLLKIIDKLVNYVYGTELRMEENEDGYLRFFSSGPVPPYHRNLAGRVWMDDNRLLNLVSSFMGTNWHETLALIAFYFSAKYNIKTMDAKPHSSWEDWEDFDYKKFDDPNYVLTDYDEQY